MNTTAAAIWYHNRLAEYRAITPHPGTTCYSCGSLATWREIDARGEETIGTEWCYCSNPECGVRLPGRVSPWSELAHRDWDETPYMRYRAHQQQAMRAYTRMRRGSFPSTYRVITFGSNR